MIQRSLSGAEVSLNWHRRACLNSRPTHQVATKAALAVPKAKKGKKTPKEPPPPPWQPQSLVRKSIMGAFQRTVLETTLPEEAEEGEEGPKDEEEEEQEEFDAGNGDDELESNLDGGGGKRVR